MKKAIILIMLIQLSNVVFAQEKKIFRFPLII